LILKLIVVQMDTMTVATHSTLKERLARILLEEDQDEMEGSFSPLADNYGQQIAVGIPM